jgi:ESF2/ABP1 family protein
MKPVKIRNIFSQFGVVGRIYLAAESTQSFVILCSNINQDPELRTKRRQAGGNKRKNFTEGWVEFEDKNVAKIVTLSLNNTPIGGPKGNYYRLKIIT